MCSLINMFNIFNLKTCILKFIKNMKYSTNINIIVTLCRGYFYYFDEISPIFITNDRFLLKYNHTEWEKLLFKSDPKVRFSKYEDLWSSWGLKNQFFLWARVIMVWKFFLQVKTFRIKFLWIFYLKIWPSSSDIRIDVLKIYS